MFTYRGTFEDPTTYEYVVFNVARGTSGKRSTVTLPPEFAREALSRLGYERMRAIIRDAALAHEGPGRSKAVAKALANALAPS